MIGYLRGVPVELDEAQVVLDVNGVGYQVRLPDIEAKALKVRMLTEGADGASFQVTLYTYYHQPQGGSPVLFGFSDKGSREFFEHLLTVAGMGPASAAKAMVLHTRDLATAIEQRDLRVLSSLPGVGKRKAEQIVATLKGKVLRYALIPVSDTELPAGTVVEAPIADFAADVEEVLQDLGYKKPEAARMVAAALKRRPDLKDAQSLLQEIWAGERK
ncbi:MAG TPA: Holliday junction branch migration protein RuvA [Armatimonadota bacterium]|jgi:Holliday junction DNA helicase RuvA